MQVREVEGPALVSAPPRLVSFASVPLQRLESGVGAHEG